MKIRSCVIITLFILLNSCSEESLHQKANKINTISAAKKEPLDSNVIVNACKADHYFWELKEDYRLDTSAFTLTLFDSTWMNTKEYKLDLPKARAKIMYCTNWYAVVGFPCGGPCTADVFVFIDDSRPIEIYGYVQRINSNENIITYIHIEEFDNLIIYNLRNQKKMIMDVCTCKELQVGPCHMDSIYLVDEETLAFEYTTMDDSLYKNRVNIRRILAD